MGQPQRAVHALSTMPYIARSILRTEVSLAPSGAGFTFCSIMSHMTKQHLIIAVCRGNIGRSPFAEMIIRRELIKRSLADKYRVISRGTQGTTIDPVPVKFPNLTYYESIYTDSKPILDKFGIDMSKHVSTPISEADAIQAAILIAMDEKTRDGLRVLFPDQVHKIYMLSEFVGKQVGITDPAVVSGLDSQTQIFSELNDMIIDGFPTLLKTLKRRYQLLCTIDAKWTVPKTRRLYGSSSGNISTSVTESIIVSSPTCSCPLFCTVE